MCYLLSVHMHIFYSITYMNSIPHNRLFISQCILYRKESNKKILLSPQFYPSRKTGHYKLNKILRDKFKTQEKRFKTCSILSFMDHSE